LSGLLLDTNVFVWSYIGHPRVGSALRERLRSEERFVSQVCGIEIAIKISLGRMSLSATGDGNFTPTFLAGCRDLEADVLDVGYADLDRLSRLPLLHRDPFDRLIICQALSRGLTVVTGDHAFKAYAGLDVLEI
jgi:PIN domain nuclease of toxin-antitoxin system